MTITDTTSIAEIAATIPASVRVFQRHGLDFCCGGKRPLALACEQLGLSFADLRDEIETSTAATVDDRDWMHAPLDALIAHIVTSYHAPLRTELPRLVTMADKVAQVHGTKASALVRVAEIVRALAIDLTQHMQKEELVLFPAIRARLAGDPRALPIEVPSTVMEQEHDDAGELLAELKALCDGYVTPDWACATVRALYQGLEEFERSMHVHVHLENNVLFPRAVAAGR